MTTPRGIQPKSTPKYIPYPQHLAGQSRKKTKMTLLKTTLLAEETTPVVCTIQAEAARSDIPSPVTGTKPFDPKGLCVQSMSPCMYSFPNFGHTTEAFGSLGGREVLSPQFTEPCETYLH